MGARGGGGKSWRSPPPPLENNKKISLNGTAFLLLVLNIGAFATMCRPFCYFFLYVGALVLPLWGAFLGPPPYKNFGGRPFEKEVTTTV